MSDQSKLTLNQFAQKTKSWADAADDPASPHRPDDRGSAEPERDIDRPRGGDRVDRRSAERDNGGYRDRPGRDNYGGGRDRDRNYGGDRERGYGGDRDRDRGYGGDRGDRGNRSGGRYDDRREDREPRPIPDQPPFKAYIGNLPYDVEQNDIAIFLESAGNNIDIKEIHLVMDREENRFKGFAYATFDNRKSLEAVLRLNGADFDGRTVRLDVASDRQGDRRGGGRGGDRRGGDRDDRRGFENFGRRSGDRQDRDDAYERPRGDRPARAPTDSEYDDRGVRVRRPTEEPPAPTDDAAGPKERPKLKLLKKTAASPAGSAAIGNPSAIPAQNLTSPDAAAAKKPKSNPFGAAKPREEVLQERAKVDPSALEVLKAEAESSSRTAVSSTERGGREREREDRHRREERDDRRRPNDRDRGDRSRDDRRHDDRGARGDRERREDRDERRGSAPSKERETRSAAKGDEEWTDVKTKGRRVTAQGKPLPADDERPAVTDKNAFDLLNDGEDNDRDQPDQPDEPEPEVEVEEGTAAAKPARPAKGKKGSKNRTAADDDDF